MSAQSNAALMRKGYDAFSRGDMERFGMSSSLLTLSGIREGGIRLQVTTAARMKFLACSANCFN